MTAVISADDRYRYRLDRTWPAMLGELGRIVWVMLNPSTADANLNDPTIRRCIGFTKAWGYAALTVVNLYAYRATNPRELNNVRDPIGPDWTKHARAALTGADLIIGAWGAHVDMIKGGRDWAAKVSNTLGAICPQETYHLGRTKAGHPRHPLYLRADTTPIRWAA